MIERAHAVAIDDGLNVYVAGETGGSLPAGGGILGGTDGFVVKFDARGRRIWTRQLGSPGDDAVLALALSPDALTIYAAGSVGATPAMDLLNALVDGGEQQRGDGRDGFVAALHVGGATASLAPPLRWSTVRARPPPSAWPDPDSCACSRKQPRP